MKRSKGQISSGLLVFGQTFSNTREILSVDAQERESCDVSGMCCGLRARGVLNYAKGSHLPSVGIRDLWTKIVVLLASSRTQLALLDIVVMNVSTFRCACQTVLQIRATLLASRG